jgi:predicted CopG family antitoxin
MEAQTPALQMICDWIMSSDNTNLTIEFLLNYLEQLKRDDAIKIINNERENETINSSVFISYQWDSQDEVIKIKDCLEKSGFKCMQNLI